MSEEVLQRVWLERGLQDALVRLYCFQQGVSHYPSVIAGAESLFSLGLAVKKRGRLVLTPSGLSLAYHFIEYRKQVEQDGLNPILERLKIDENSVVLDFGCGAGQTLLAVLRFNPRTVTGIDRDGYAVKFAEFLFRQIGISSERYFLLNSEISAVPLLERSFTHVICRLVLYRTRVSQTLSILSRAFKDNGCIYVLAHSAGYYFSRLRIVLRNPAWLGYFLFVFLNGLLFASFGRQATLRVGKRRLSELFFTEGSLKRALRRNGFKVEIFRRQSENNRRVIFEVFGRRMER